MFHLLECLLLFSSASFSSVQFHLSTLLRMFYIIFSNCLQFFISCCTRFEDKLSLEINSSQDEQFIKNTKNKKRTKK